MAWSYLVLHKVLAQCWANVGPASNDGKYTGYGNIIADAGNYNTVAYQLLIAQRYLLDKYRSL